MTIAGVPHCAGDVGQWIIGGEKKIERCNRGTQGEIKVGVQRFRVDVVEFIIEKCSGLPMEIKWMP